MNLKEGETKPVELTSWADESLKKKVSLKDDQDKSYELLEQVAAEGSDGKTITENWINVHLVFQAPTNKKLKFLHLTLPSAAFQADGADDRASRSIRTTSSGRAGQGRKSRPHAGDSKARESEGGRSRRPKRR